MYAGAVPLAVAVVLGSATPAAAAPAYPRPEGRCVDQTGVLGHELCAKVTKILLRDERSGSDEIAVAVVRTTGDATIETWSTGLFNTWGVGKRDKNNGVLLVVALDDRRLRLETGRGLAQRLPDQQAREIITSVITPEFAAGRHAEGILAGLDAVRRRLGHRFSADHRLATLAPRPATAGPGEADSDPDTGDEVPSTVIYDGGFGDDGFLLGGESGPGGGFPGWFCLVFALAVAGIAVGAVRGLSGGSGGFPHRRRTSGPGWHQSTHGHASSSSWSGGSSFGSSDSSSSSSSGFGGGGSDGGGSSGSW